MVKGKDRHFPLPSCQFVPNYCSEELLKTVGKGESIFKPGQVVRDGKEQNISPHSAVIECNDDGFHMSIHRETWRGPNKVMIENIIL